MRLGVDHNLEFDAATADALRHNRPGLVDRVPHESPQQLLEQTTREIPHGAVWHFSIWVLRWLFWIVLSPIILLRFMWRHLTFYRGAVLGLMLLSYLVMTNAYAPKFLPISLQRHWSNANTFLVGRAGALEKTFGFGQIRERISTLTQSGTPRTVQEWNQYWRDHGNQLLECAPHPTTREKGAFWLAASPWIHVRSGPGTEYSPKTRIGQGAVAKVLRGFYDGWQEVELPDGTRGYVKAKLGHYLLPPRCGMWAPREGVRVCRYPTSGCGMIRRTSGAELFGLGPLRIAPKQWRLVYLNPGLPGFVEE